MDEQEFRDRCDAALAALFQKLAAAGDESGFEVDQNGGALQIEFDEPPARFVVSPNSPVRQIWVSANVKSFKLDWDPARSAFALPGGRTLLELMADAVSQHLGEKVSLE
jgi:CyaY protein